LTFTQVESSGQESYIFDRDGFLVQRDKETYEYDPFGRLQRAFEPGRYDIRYFYDARQRLAVRRDASKGAQVQFFYADLSYPTHVTHVWDDAAKRVSEFYYDRSGRLFAMRREGDVYYIGLDPDNSPIVILNGVGSVVKQVTIYIVILMLLIKLYFYI